MFTQTVSRALSGLGLDQRGADPYPCKPAPMLLHKADAVFSSADWTYEPKWDGFRVLASTLHGPAAVDSGWKAVEDRVVLSSIQVLCSCLCVTDAFIESLVEAPIVAYL